MEQSIVHWVPSHEDTCTFMCDTGYELTGSYFK